MQALKYLDNNHPFHNLIDKEIGYGADGQIFSLKNSNKVLKVSILFEYSKFFERDYNLIVKNIRYLQENPNNLFVNIYDFNFELDGLRKTFNGNQRFKVYSYYMEKLNKLSQDENIVFDKIGDLDALYFDNDFYKSVVKMIGDLKHLSFDRDKVLDFCKGLLNTNIFQEDYHIANLMKDDCGNFKFIDIDRIKIY